MARQSKPDCKKGVLTKWHPYRRPEGENTRTKGQSVAAQRSSPQGLQQASKQPGVLQQSESLLSTLSSYPDIFQELRYGPYVSPYPPLYPLPQAGTWIYARAELNYIDANHLLRMTALQGEGSWMDDQGLDMSLELLGINNNCSDVGIAIMSSLDAQTFAFISSPEEASSCAFTEYRERLAGKSYVFLPINDGLNGQHAGSHWSLIALDLNMKTAHYYDSFYLDWPSQHALFRKISLNLLKVLEVEESGWCSIVEGHSPHQVHHNLCDSDYGPCAPFVYKMTEWMVRMLIHHHQHPHQYPFPPTLTLQYRPEFAECVFKPSFHSADIKRHMQWTVMHHKHTQDARQIEVSLPDSDDRTISLPSSSPDKNPAVAEAQPTEEASPADLDQQLLEMAGCASAGSQSSPSTIQNAVDLTGDSVANAGEGSELPSLVAGPVLRENSTGSDGLDLFDYDLYDEQLP